MLQLVRDTTARVVNSAKHVIIDDSAIQKVCELLAKDVWGRLSSDDKGDENIGQAVSSDGFVESLFVEWDNEKVHFRDLEDPDLTAQYILVLSSLNFCFWPGVKRPDGPEGEEYEYHHLAGALRDVLLEDKEAFSAASLSNCDEKTLLKWFKCEIPQAAERARLVREVGVGLQTHFNGKASKLITSAGNSVSKLVALVTAFFPGFRDHTIYDGAQVFLYKRAQIFCADIWGCFKHEGLGKFDDMHKLTMFADYRVPQILRHYEVLKYSESLSDSIDNYKVIPPGSAEEVEIRAATIQCVERMRIVLQNSHRIRCKSVELDWLLWQRGEEQRKEVAPHHRTLTIFY
ncbi:hypothetical protein AKO1_010958 [Acrasis kona]|uniref:Queuosine 5'-phosphate N-glycosylase/hydrolase n=1 Tax=Acrasis kona TaxID=1008807 RepID=A0AAW2YS15_9EUKA